MPEKNISTDDLAAMIQSEFDNIRSEFGNVNLRFDKVEADIAELKRGQEEIKLKFAYTAWAIDLEELKKRVKVLEDKLGS